LSGTPFDYLRHLVTVPVVVNGSTEARFVLDSGIGLTIVSESLAEATGSALTGCSYVGTRMSGQSVTIPVGTVSSLPIGAMQRDELEVGVLDMSAFPPEFDGIGGFIALGFFRGRPFTLDYPRQTLVLETEETLLERAASGTPLDVRIERDEHSITAFLPLTIPGGKSVSVEVDMGSDSLILDVSLAAEVGVELDDPNVRRVEGVDETGHRFTRYFTRIEGEIHPTDAPDFVQQNPDLMFQEIIYDGLLGHSFLRNFIVTYDLHDSRLILARLP
jgi:hypothetical protein